MVSNPSMSAFSLFFFLSQSGSPYSDKAKAISICVCVHACMKKSFVIK